MASFFPAIGSWYQELGTSANFEVVAVDENHGSIEIQYQDGDIDEFDIESWGRMNILRVSEGENGSGVAYAPENDIYYGDNFDSNLGNPLENFDPDSFSGFDDLF